MSLPVLDGFSGSVDGSLSETQNNAMQLKVIAMIDKYHCNVYRLASNPDWVTNGTRPWNNGRYAQYFLDHCSHYLIIDINHLSPPQGQNTDPTKTDSYWSDATRNTRWAIMETSVFEALAKFPNNMRVIIEIVNEYNGNDLHSRVQTIINHIRNGWTDPSTGVVYPPYQNVVLQNDQWQSPAKYTDNLNPVEGGQHAYMNKLTSSPGPAANFEAKIQAIINAGFTDICVTEVGAATSEGTYTDAQMAELEKYLTWCAQKSGTLNSKGEKLRVGSCIWMTHNIDNLAAYEAKGFYFPLPAVVNYTLTILSGTGGTTNPTAGTYTHPENSIIPITAIPNSGYTFSNWLINGSPVFGNPINVTLDANATVQPVFSPIQVNHVLTVVAGLGGTTNPATGPHTYPDKTPVTVTAYPSTGYDFSKWNLNGSEMLGNPINLIMDADATIQPVFTPASSGKQEYFRSNDTSLADGLGRTVDRFGIPFTIGYQIPSSEPCTRAPEKGQYDWVSVIDTGNIYLAQDPAFPTDITKICLKAILDKAGTRPLASAQSAKLYEMSGRHSADYAGDWVNKLEGWWNFKIWMPSNFAVPPTNGWRLLWQSYGAEPIGYSGGPQFQITAGSTNINFKVVSYATASAGTDVTTSSPTAASRFFVVSTVANFPKDRWVLVSVYIKQGSKFRVADGKLQVWLSYFDDLGNIVTLNPINRTDVETSILPQVTWDYDHGYTDPGTNSNLVLWSSLTQAQKDANNAQKQAWFNKIFPYHGWGIANYGSAYEAYGQYHFFKEVNTSNERELLELPTNKTLEFISSPILVPATLNGATIYAGEPIDPFPDGTQVSLAVPATIGTFNVTIIPGAGGITDPPAGTYPFGNGARGWFTAIPNAGKIFDHWIKDGTTTVTNNPTALIVTSDRTLQPVFV